MDLGRCTEVNIALPPMLPSNLMRWNEHRRNIGLMPDRLRLNHDGMVLEGV